MQKRHFTLLELMAAMIVLVIMMGFLFHFITSSQTLWSASERNARVYENGQIFFELIERDLRGAMANDAAGQEIGFWIENPSTATGDFLTMVSNMPPPVDTESGVCEIHYRLVATSNPTVFRLERAVVEQTDSTGAWDFYGKNGTSGPPSWVTTDGGASNWQEVIDGVESVDMTCYDTSGTALSQGRVYFALPAALRFTVTLVDQKVVDLGYTGTALSDRLDASRRQFTKVIIRSR